MYAAVALLKVVVEHGIKKELAFKAIGDDLTHGLFTLLYLCPGVAAEAYAVLVEPLYFCQLLSEGIGDQTCIESLVEVNLVATLNDFIELLMGVVSSSKEIIIYWCPLKVENR